MQTLRLRRRVDESGLVLDVCDLDLELAWLTSELLGEVGGEGGDEGELARERSGLCVHGLCPPCMR